MPAAYAGIIAAVIGAAGSAYSANEQGNDAAEAARQRSEGTQSVNPWAPSIPYLEQALKQASQWGQTPLPYDSEHPMVQPLNQIQQTAAGQMLYGADQMAGPAGAVVPSFQKFVSGDMMNVNNNPYLQGAIQAAVRPITENYQENVLPSIRGQYAGDDAYNQSRQGIAEGVASRGYMNAVQDAAMQMANRGYETGMQATQRSFDQFPQVAQAAQSQGQNTWNVGALLQGQAQKEADSRGALDQMALQRITLPFDVFRSAGGIGRDSATTGVTQNPYATQNPVTAGIGGALTGYQIGKQFQTTDGRSTNRNYTTGYSTAGLNDWGGGTGQFDYGGGDSNVWYGW
jgi:hypothetical protein